MNARPPPVMIVTGDFVQTGGMDVGNYALADYFAKRGGEVHLVAFRVAEPLASLPGVVWHRVPKPLGSYTLALPLLDHYGRRVAKRITARGGRVIVNGGSCWWGDLNWVHYVHAAHRPMVSASSLPRRWVSRYNHARWLYEEKRALLDARVVITNSDRTRRDVIERIGVAPERVRTIYYGIDATRFSPADTFARLELRQRFGWPAARPVALFIGNLGDGRKGFDVLFEAWRKCCIDPAWDADLMVIGHGAELPGWKRRTGASGLAERIHFLGFRPDVNDLLRAADVLVSPTRYEAYGLGVHEALCCGIPAIVTADAGVAERYPAFLRGLLLADPLDADALARCLGEWREQAETLRAAVRPLAQQLAAWTWTNMAEQFEVVMQSSAEGDTR
jgi:glycosyltransferase involved in cell wall biosynthesis